MPRGKKTSPKTIYAIMTSWAITNSYKETARALDLPVTTVKSLVDKHKDEPEFVKLRNEKMNEFSNRASEIIQKGLTLLNKRLDKALNYEDELDELIEEIWDTDKDEMSYQEKQSLVNKIKGLQLQDIKAITTAIGTLYDKKALADGNATEKMVVEVKLPEGIDEYAG